MSGPRAAPASGQDGALSSLERADLTRMRSSLAALHEVAFAAGGAPDLATLTGLSVDHARALLDADGAFLSRLEDDGTLRRLATAHRDGHSWMPADLRGRFPSRDGALERLRSLGARLVIDNFGTGYSSLAYLRRFPVDGIKIDRSFIQHLRDDESTGMIVRTTVELGHGLGLRVTAEGVEDGDTLAAAVAIGCDAAQGFHMARPMPAAEIDRWLEESPFGARAIAV